tara:strand:- start:493 stop:696 length:204 start_codon:yes stop_codon:yes gene_type:complete
MCADIFDDDWVRLKLFFFFFFDFTATIELAVIVVVLGNFLFTSVFAVLGGIIGDGAFDVGDAGLLMS